MDRQTLANYGWIVIVALILAVMLALATPFGKYVMDGVSSIASGYINTSNEAMSDANKDKLVAEWEDKWANSTCTHESQSVGMSDATCTQNGIEGKVICNDCKKVLNEGTVVPAFGHNTKTINATNRYTGDEYCERCETIIEHGEEIPVTILQFTINGTKYSYEDGMTWEEWANSDYNTSPYYAYKNPEYNEVTIRKSDTYNLIYDSCCLLNEKIQYKSQLNEDTVSLATGMSVGGHHKILPIKYGWGHVDESIGIYFDVKTPIGTAKSNGYAIIAIDGKGWANGYEIVYLS